jgi:hypothetical protein
MKMLATVTVEVKHGSVRELGTDVALGHDAFIKAQAFFSPAEMTQMSTI